MDFVYSPSQDASGTCHLSPSHLRHVDSVSAMRNLRRSLSRSPSRSHLLPSKSRSSSPKSPKSPTQFITSPLKIITSLPASSSPFEPVSPAATSGSQTASIRKTRPMLRRTTPLRNLANSRSISGTPIRRALSDSSDNGNSNTPVAPLPAATDGQENATTPDSSPLGAGPFGTREVDEIAKSKISATDDFPMTHPLREWNKAKSSPLKRSDGVMNLENSQFGSPFAKRRTICISSMNSPFQISDETRDHPIGHLSDDDGSSDEMTFRLRPTPPRLPGLRRSTIQQRTLEKANMGRSRRSVDFVPMSPSNLRNAGRTRSRASLDNYARKFELDRDSVGLEGPSHPISRTPVFPRPNRQNPHPLSKALTTSSPTPPRMFNAAPQETEPKGLFSSPSVNPINFSKSLPIGALRPQFKPNVATNYDDMPSEISFATPESYRMARPDPAAFRSTGLISKRHRNPEDLPPPPGHPGMPDTPCKKVPIDFIFSSSPTPSNTAVKPRVAQPVFNTPSKLPLGLQIEQSTTPGPLFGQTTNTDLGHDSRSLSLKQQSSFIGADGNENPNSPIDKTDGQSSADELPPTPTKQASGKPNSLRSRLLGRRPSVGPGTFVAPDQTLEVPSTTTHQAEPSVSHYAAYNIPNESSPKTPGDNLIPDPSGLSISPSGRKMHSPSLRPNTLRSSWTPTPETPSSHQRNSNDQLSTKPCTNVTPSNHGNNVWSAGDVDLSLNARFKKSEWYARGEFSDVYKVFQPAESMEGVSYFNFLLNTVKTAATPLPDRVWVVKKSRMPYSGLKLREKKLKEASIMRALGKHDHVVNYLDSWEANAHLYIQMEFCEGGSLESFLARTGNKGRLDDFRIWKILIELSLGVQHIHHSGFLHLDLKPANVFITFEGTLKIGDFGLATEFPAPAHTEGEGDRRYMGPDLLQGSTDKPADIFALGMMMFEIGGNLVLPDNGASWQKLRSGDWSGLPSLTSGSTQSIFHDSGTKLDVNSRLLDDVIIERSNSSQMSPLDVSMPLVTWKEHGPDADESSSEEWAQPPKFMLDPEDEQALDRLVHWMMLPTPQDRPTIDEVLNSGGVQWVDPRRRAGATVFEGNWGPPNSILNHTASTDSNIDTIIISAPKNEDLEMLDA